MANELIMCLISRDKDISRQDGIVSGVWLLIKVRVRE